MRLDGAIDLHCHYGPDNIRPANNPVASVTAAQAVREAANAGYAALVLKSKDFSTAALAFALQELIGGIRVFGGITTDLPSGGLNPIAVEQSLRLGAKIVWLPTSASAVDVARHATPAGKTKKRGISVIDDDGKLRTETMEILDLVATYDAVLATGHTSSEEHFVVAKEFARRGRVLVTHAGESVGAQLDLQRCRELADLGATIEFSALSCTTYDRPDGSQHVPKSFSDMTAMVNAVGPGRCVLSSDEGFSDAVPRPVPRLSDFLDSLWNLGATEEELSLMTVENPARLLALA